MRVSPLLSLGGNLRRNPTVIAVYEVLFRWRQISPEEFNSRSFSPFLIQEGQLSVSGERMCTILVYRLED